MWSFAIALGVFAFDAAGATAVGVAGLVRILPGAFASPFAGVLGDRFSRRAVLLWSTVAAGAALTLATVAAVLGAPAGLIFALAGLYTVTFSPYIPTEAALMPSISRTPQELSAANVTHAFMDNAGFLLGSIMAGILLATTSSEFVFSVAAATTILTAGALLGISRDRRPAYARQGEIGSVARETRRGLRALLADPLLRLIGSAFTLLAFVEGAADVVVVIVALDLIGLGESSVGYLNAAWGVGALLAASALAVLLDRGRLVAGLAVGALVFGAAMAAPGAWPVAVAAYAGWIGLGVGFTFVEVGANTLLQRLGDDEVLARVRGALETARLAAMALGAIAVAALVALAGIRVTLIAFGALMPMFALLRWVRLRSFEIGSPVDETRYALLRGSPIFEPLPVDRLERICHGLRPQWVRAGEEIVTQGEPGVLFYLIESGQVEVIINGDFRGHQGVGECFGEIALLRNAPRSATVRAAVDTTLLALDRDHFVSAVTGHVRSTQAADVIVDEWLAGPPREPGRADAAANRPP